MPLAVSRLLCVLLLFASLFLTSRGAVAAPTAAASPAVPSFTVDKVLGDVDGWKIGVSNSLGGCIARTAFDDQTVLWFGMGGKDDRGFLVITNPVWSNLQIGSLYDMKINMAKATAWRGKAQVIDRSGDKGFYVGDLKDDVVGQFARGQSIDIQVDNKTVASLPLTSSSSAVAAMIQCQVSFAKLREQGDAAKPAEASTGTGFFVSWRGQVLTNHHVVEGCKVLEVVRPGLPPVPAKLVADDAANDLALLQTSLRTRQLPAFATRVRIGQGAYAYGFPLTGLLTSEGNFTIGNVSAVAGVGDDTSRLQISTPVQPGNSGGPLLDQSGNVIGVIVSKLNALELVEKTGTKDIVQNVNFAIKSSAALTFLEAHGVEPRSEPRGKPLDGEALADLAKEFTVRVECDVER